MEYVSLNSIGQIGGTLSIVNSARCALSDGTNIQEWNTALKWAIANENVKIIVQTGRGKYYTTGFFSEAQLT